MRDAKETGAREGEENKVSGANIFQSGDYNLRILYCHPQTSAPLSARAAIPAISPPK